VARFAVEVLFTGMSMLLVHPPGFGPLTEKLTKTDKEDIKRMISKEVKAELKAALEDELSKALRTKATKEEIGDITKKVLKKLYKDLSFHHPYIIDRVKI
jgi:hypothetical protein